MKCWMGVIDNLLFVITQEVSYHSLKIDAKIFVILNFWINMHQCYADAIVKLN